MRQLCLVVSHEDMFLSLRAIARFVVKRYILPLDRSERFFVYVCLSMPDSLVFFAE